MASSVEIIGVLLFLVPVTWVLQILSRGLLSPLSKIPGPIWSRYTNLPLKLALLSGKRTLFIHDLHKKYGPVVRISPGEVSISDPTACRTIHRAGSGFLKSDWYSRFVDHEVPGIFEMSDAKQHAARRRLLARAFTKTELRARWEGMIQTKTKLAMERISGEIESAGQVDVLKWWAFLATDVVGHLMFGESFRMLDLGEKNDYIRVLESTAKGRGMAVELPLLDFIGRHIPHPTFRALFHGHNYLIDYGKRAIAMCKSEDSEAGNIFARLQATDTSATDFPLTELDISTEAGNLILAGSDTTAFSLSYITWSVLDHPDVQARLEAEVATLNGDFTDANLETLPMLSAVINETLRIWGASSGSLPRAVPKGGAELAGHYIPEGYTVSTQSWTLHRDEKFWPEPEKFNPDRWLNDPSPEAAKMAFSPFGAGSRACLGIHLAMMELRIAIAMFFYRFRGARLVPGQTMEVENFFLIKPKMEHMMVLPAGEVL
ncbi:Cytochrome P450 monooxygenase aflV [Lasiodiplodia hormozganensis]|uniref:Cytochrome P450 monooxygenase aflV n=1 Tax=Lasiodiplodia hormozganensis TaxID=869390 RepID=A0AA40BYZ3_9PEZI|nr:Cytochrome P450 monooxygenase aflV [Lasiodiplodia hormozganensis]